VIGHGLPGRRGAADNGRALAARPAIGFIDHQNGISMKSLLVAAAIALAAAAFPSSAEIISRPVQFKRGTNAVTLVSSLKDGQAIDYKVRARAGQTLGVRLRSRHQGVNFNILPPAADGVAIFTGSTAGRAWSGSVPADGVYTVRTYLMRSAARRNEAAKFTLTIDRSGSPAATGARAGDARVKGTPYHATGKLPCSLGDAPAGSAQCAFGVIRGKSGDAEVHVTSPEGVRQVLLFSGGTVGAKGEARVNASKHDDEWRIDLNDNEHYRIPEAVISGG